jgi:hypothetical protein
MNLHSQDFGRRVRRPRLAEDARRQVHGSVRQALDLFH